MASDPAPTQDQQAQVEAALQAAESAVTQLKDRVTTDLTNLRAELDSLHQQQQSSGTVADLTTVIQRIETITTSISQIDASAVEAPAATGGVGTVPAATDPAATGGDAPAVTGDQGQTVETGTPVGTEQTPPGA